MGERKDLASRLVVKSNELIQASRFSLTLIQQRIVLFLISQISEGDQDFKEYQFDVGEFCALCGLDRRNGKHYQDIKNALQTISDKSLWIDIDGVDTLIRWIEKPKINKKTHKISVRLDSDMMPFLLQLKRNFTMYELRWILQFKSKYSHRLYELIKSVFYNPLDPYEYTFDLEFLKERMDAKQYNWQDFKARALEPAVMEINRYSDLNVSYKTIRAGRTVIKVIVHMETKDVEERVRMTYSPDDQLYKLLCCPAENTVVQPDQVQEFEAMV